MAPAISTTTNRFFCHFGQFLAPNNLKNQNFKTLKKNLEILSFYTIVPKIMIICYTVPEIWCVKDVSVMSFWDFFPFYPPNSLKKENFKKMRKKSPEMSSFTQVHQKLSSYGILFWRYGVWQM